MKAFFVIALIMSLGSSAGMSQAIMKPHDASALVVEAKLPLGGVSGRIDHMALDVDHLHLFVAELGNNTVGVVSLAERKVIHVIDGLKEPQGVRYVPSVDALYVANAGDGAVGIYEGPNYALKDRLDLGDDADNIRFDPRTNQIFVGYGSGGIAIIDALTRRRVLDIALNGHPEGFQIAGDGERIFVNVPTNREVAVIDRRAGKQVGKWDLRYHGNFPMALDEQGQRVLVGFRSPPRLSAYSMRDGAPLAAVEVCGDTDDVFFDPKRARIYVSCGEGLLDVLERQDGNYQRVARIPTSPGSRTALFSPEQDRLFLAVRATPVEPAAVWIFRPIPMMLIMKSSTIRKLFATCLSILLSIPAGFRAAWAYRPFDGTDAAVADPGEVEIELQPAGALWVNSEPNLVAPALVYNYGLLKDWELVLEGRGLTPLSPSGPTEVTEAAASLKYILRPGVLQDKTGPSIATEFGVLLPDSIGPSGFGATVAGIVSQRWDWGTVHLNVETALTRDQRANVFGGAIIEGPYQWKVRPVAEFFYEEEFGSFHSVSGLIGAIWQVRDNLRFDVAFRHAFTNGHPVEEVRAGMTFGFQLIPFKRMGQK